ncbi:hypothetical protein [Candidatus Uabimicrobium amorphum]|uniref:Uncharacterized protein n=1 Tax=Uabimicrobium amorphum TaxID=2596890 RepID=A0A5S9ILV5_UABAM|nr:hypothetical protein [Candidatus Uabimicrobium amorphum]BBM84288.1 hypothetical protein UABAM_02645 [Candidatus Uabimicrobium amorphum]
MRLLCKNKIHLICNDNFNAHDIKLSQSKSIKTSQTRYVPPVGGTVIRGPQRKLRQELQGGHQHGNENLYESL